MLPRRQSHPASSFPACTHRYAAELVAREEAALGLVREMLGYEGREAGRDAAAAEQRLAAGRLDAADADAELARAQAEGPASHRKRDYIDKVRLGGAARGFKYWVCARPIWGTNGHLSSSRTVTPLPYLLMANRFTRLARTCTTAANMK